MHINDITEDLMGDVAFGDFRRLREPDTDFESIIFDMMLLFVDDGEIYRNNHKFAARLRKLNQYKEKFPGQLKPNAKNAYRGSSVPLSTVSNANTWPLKRFDGREWYAKESFTYKPRSLVQSWTTRIPIAFKFALDNSDTDLIPVIIQTAIDDTFVLNPRFTNKLSTKMHNSREHEIIRTVKSPIKATLYVHAPTFNIRSDT